jgi:UDP-galactopyranose mutase
MEYTVSEMAEEMGWDYIRVYKRYVSPFSDKRWGVMEKKMPDGTFKRVVPAEKLYLWKQDINYQGRPRFETDPSRDRKN